MPSSIAFFAKVTSSCCIFLARLVFHFQKIEKKEKRLPEARNGLHLLRKESSQELLLFTYKEKLKRGSQKKNGETKCQKKGRKSKKQSVLSPFCVWCLVLSFILLV